MRAPNISESVAVPFASMFSPVVPLPFTSNVVLILLRRIDERTERMSDDLQDLKIRMTSVEEGLAGASEMESAAAELGAGAARVLLRRLEGDLSPPSETVVPVELVVRASCGAPAQARTVERETVMLI